MVIRDCNAKVGTHNVGWEHVMGRYGYGDRNERGERLLEFASKYDLLITNTRFQQKESRIRTWITPDGKHTNMIDLVLWKTDGKRRYISAERIKALTSRQTTAA